MRMRQSFAIVCVTASLLAAGSLLATTASAQTAALTGKVTSIEDGPLEGVLVSAQQPGSSITISVVTDERGRYSFPAAGLAPGRHALRIRASGYDLDGSPVADIATPGTAQVDLLLRKTADLAAQLTNAEWMASVPGTPR